MSKALNNLIVEEVTITGDDHRPVNRRRIALFKGELNMPENKKIEIADSLVSVVEYLADATQGVAIMAKGLEIVKACNPKATEKAQVAISNALKMLEGVKAEMDPEMWQKITEAMGMEKAEKSQEDVTLEAFAKSAGLELTKDNRPAVALAHQIHLSKAQADNERIKVLEEEVRKSKEAAHVEEVRKSVQSFEKAVPASVEDLVEILKSLPKTAGEKFVALLTKSAEAIKKGGLLDEKGTGAEGDATSAWAIVESKAMALAEKAKISKADAITAVLKAEPALYERYEAERTEKK